MISSFQANENALDAGLFRELDVNRCSGLRETQSGVYMEVRATEGLRVVCYVESDGGVLTSCSHAA